MKQATITIHDEVNAEVTMSDMVDLRTLVKKYSLPVKNHFFNPRYKIGAWDGKLQFFTDRGKTYVPLLEEIIPILVQQGAHVDLIDNRVVAPKDLKPVAADFFSHIIYPDTGEPITIADHQLRIINALLAETNGVGEAATGAGKTIITGAMCLRLREAGMATLVIVPNLDLIENTRDELVMLGIDDIGVMSGTEKDPDHNIVISTWQTLKNMPILMKSFQAVIVDETHGARGTELKKLLIEYGSHIAYRYGLTGTIPDDPCEAMTVKIGIGPVRAVVTAAELIAIGWLATLDINVLELEEDLRAEFADFKAKARIDNTTYPNFKKKYFPDYAAEKKYLIKHKGRNQWIADHLDQKRLDTGNTLVLVSSIDQGKALAALTPNSVFVHGADKVKARKQIYQLFKDHDDLLVYATVGIASTGINIKRIFNLVFVDIGKSFIRVIQSIGRGLRKGSGKSHLIVTDIASDLKYGQKHVKDRKKYYDQKQYPHTTKRVDYMNQ